MEGFVNFAFPYLIYSWAQPRLGDVNALIASSGPPILWSVVEFGRNRRIDALSVIVLLGLGLSLVAFLGGGSVRFLQLREKLVTVIIGIVFLGSAAIGRPLMYGLVRAFLTRANDPELRRVESLRYNSGFRAAMTIMTVVWGAGLLADAAVSIVLVVRFVHSDLSRRESDHGLRDNRFADSLELLVRQKDATQR